MKNHKTYPGMVRLADEKYRIAKELGIEPNTKEFWHIYRVILGFLAEKPQTTIRGEKHGDWHVQKDDIDKFIEMQWKVIEQDKQRKGIHVVSEKNSVGIVEVKQLIQDLEEVGVDPEKTLKMLKKKLGLN